MILVIAGTNRPDSKTEIIADHYYKELKEKSSEPVAYYSLQDMPDDVISPMMYNEENQSTELAEVQDEMFVPATKWVLVMPEYNGSYPGILKLFLDAMSVRKYAETFKHKKLALVGVASGRAGNLRGMDQLTNSMNYLGFNVMGQKLPIPLIKDKTDDISVTDESLKELISSHIDNILKF